jgi:hypothetical protein
MRTGGSGGGATGGGSTGGGGASGGGGYYRIPWASGKKPCPTKGGGASGTGSGSGAPGKGKGNGSGNPGKGTTFPPTNWINETPQQAVKEFLSIESKYHTLPYDNYDYNSLDPYLIFDLNSDDWNYIGRYWVVTGAASIAVGKGITLASTGSLDPPGVLTGGLVEVTGYGLAALGGVVVFNNPVH